MIKNKAATAKMHFCSSKSLVSGHLSREQRGVADLKGSGLNGPPGTETNPTNHNVPSNMLKEDLKWLKT